MASAPQRFHVQRAWRDVARVDDPADDDRGPHGRYSYPVDASWQGRRTLDLLGADESQPGVRELVQATLDLVRGLGLANTISDDTRRRGRILDQWARTLDAALGKAAT